MNLDELKQTIELKTGVPAEFLKGETVEENIAQAKAFIAYKKRVEAIRPKTPREQFADWLGMETEEEQQDTASDTLDQIAEQARLDAGGYPILRDGGSVNVNTGDGRSAREQFNEWIGQKTAFNPYNNDGWTRLY